MEIFLKRTILKAKRWERWRRGRRRTRVREEEKVIGREVKRRQKNGRRKEEKENERGARTELQT